MFGGANAREIERLRGELRALQQRVQADAEQASASAADVARLKEDRDRLAGRMALFEGLTGPLDQFVNSAKALQGSLAGMA